MTDYLTYKDKRVVVSGCFSGMGEATARLLLKLGAEVHGLDYKPSRLELASFTQTDLRDPKSIDAAAAKIGKVDALFNCAGLAQTSPPIEVMKVNYLGARRLTEALLPAMSPGSSVVSISSTAGLGWSRRLPAVMELIKIEDYDQAVDWCERNAAETVREGYTFSKEAIVVWTMMFATRLIKRGIRLNCTMPGPTQTPMMAHFESATKSSVIEAATQPINRRSTAEEQAGPLVFLNSDAASYINGVALAVDGGFLGGIATGQIDPRSLMG